MLALLLTLSHRALVPITPETWYGPAEVRFSLTTQGNPYDPNANDVQVRFTNGSETETRLAYFDGSVWRCRLLAHEPGDYRGVVTLNGSPAKVSPFSVALTTKLAMAFVRIHDDRFVLSDGTPFWPIGHSLGWTEQKVFPNVWEQLPVMGANGVTWTRIWATYWDGRNPYWLPGGQKLKYGTFSQEALAKWDATVKAAESAGVRFQWTLHHHGQVSSTVNPNWQDNPWNVRNGGFLTSAEQFFTDSEARRLTKAYLRYIVARYADSPAIMAWELFNEVQFSDAAQKGHWDWVSAWHKEMADYLRSIDPYHHLITTSSEISQPALWTDMDYYQAHGYPASIPAMVIGGEHRTDKPFFWGEVGDSDDRDTGSEEHYTVRDAIWSGVLGLNQGSAEYWNWDRMMRPGMYDEYKRASEILKVSGFLGQSELHSAPVALETSAGATLTFSPGIGWGAYTVTDFNLPMDAAPSVMGHFSSYLQGASHPDMGKPEATFHFRSPIAGSFKVHISGLSASGTSLVAVLDGQEVKSGSFAAGSSPNETWEVPFGAGEHTVTVKNTGGDWIVLSSFSVDGIAPAVSATGISNSDWGLYRVKRASDSPAKWTGSGLTLEDGRYEVKAWNLDTGALTSWQVTVSGGKMPEETMSAKDAIFVLSLVSKTK